MRIAGRMSGALGAVIATAVASSVLTFLILIAMGSMSLPTGRDVPLQIAVILSVVFFWGPAIAIVPAAILGYLVQRPMARMAASRPDGGLAPFALVSIAAALGLWLVVRVVLYVANSTPSLIDLPSLGVFLLIGLCSAFSWWLLVVEPERRG